MPRDSAYIGVGEPVSRVTDALEKKGPMLEFAAMSRGAFTQVLSMAQRGMNPASNVDCARFALAAWRETRERQNLFLAEEFPALQFLACDALLSRRRLARGAFTGVGDLEAAIHAYIAETNADPKPFVWTRTADDILASVARFCQRSSNSGH